MSYPLPAVPELSALLALLEARNIGVHLRGHLADSRCAFVDVCHTAAARLVGHQPAGLRLIYPFPISSQACLDGLDDPLQSECHELAMNIKANRPNGYSEELFQACFSGLMEQAEYVTQFAPSRVVLVADRLPDDETLDRWLALAD